MDRVMMVDLRVPQETNPMVSMLSTNEVHLWRADLDDSRWETGRFREMLSEDEIQRAVGYHFERERRHFILRRGMLRSILGRYLSIAAAEVGFVYNPYGKPALETRGGEEGLQFNMSHSEGLMLVALRRGRRVGIDIEHVRADLEIEEIAARYFSTAEQAALHALPSEDKLRAFFACWTRKEAFIKALGQGLSLPLDAFDVTLAPLQEARLLSVRESTALTAGNALVPEHHWQLQHLEPEPGYVGALCVEGDGWELRKWEAAAALMSGYDHGD
jgi:4'-phosphopantetheinyl transferase